MSNLKEIEFDAAIRGFHFYRNYWKPKANEKLLCSYERDNPFDVFAIRTCNDDGDTVGHLPRELSRVTKFLLDRDAVVSAVLTSSTYRRSPLVQGGLEIPCKVSVGMRPTVKNNEILGRYLELVKTYYVEPETPVVFGSIFFDESNVIPPISEPPEKRIRKSKAKVTKRKMKTVDIRDLFKKQTTERMEKEQGKEETVVVID